MIFLFIYHVETYLQLNICHVEKLLHMTICHMENFLHMTNFFSTHTGCDGCDKYQVCGGDGDGDGDFDIGEYNEKMIINKWQIEQTELRNSIFGTMTKPPR